MSESQTGAGNLKTLKTLKMSLGTCWTTFVFIVHVYAPMWLFICENDKAFFDLLITCACDISVHRAGSQLESKIFQMNVNHICGKVDNVVEKLTTVNYCMHLFLAVIRPTPHRVNPGITWILWTTGVAWLFSVAYFCSVIISPTFYSLNY